MSPCPKCGSFLVESLGPTFTVERKVGDGSPESFASVFGDLFRSRRCRCKVCGCAFFQNPKPPETTHAQETSQTAS